MLVALLMTLALADSPWVGAQHPLCLGAWATATSWLIYAMAPWRGVVAAAHGEFAGGVGSF